MRSRWASSRVHEGGISSPLVVQWRAGIKARGELRHDPCHFIDIVPTVLYLAGGADFPSQWKGEVAPPLPGTSLAPAFGKDGAVRHEFIYFHHIDNRAIRVGDWKLVAKGKEGPWELYNLKADRCEAKDLAARYPDKVRQMSALWQKSEDRFRAQAGPPPEKKPARRKAAAKE